MRQFIVKRVLQGLFTLFALSVVVFILARVGGDPVYLLVGLDAPPEVVEAARHELGLDEPLIVQYGIFIKDALTGDFGDSILYRKPALDLVLDRLPNSIKLVAFASVFSIPIGLLIGILCAVKRNKPIDILGRIVAVLGQSLPGFWIALMLIMFFSERSTLLPVGEMGGLDHYILPSLSLGAFLVAGIARMTRSSMLEVLSADYIVSAKARGIPQHTVILKHALRNALIPVITFGAMMIVGMMGSSVVVETVFDWPGVGRLAYQTALAADYSVIQLIVLFMGAIFIVSNLLVDILYAWIDPRIRY